MQPEYIALSVFFGVWVAFLLTFGILALVFQNRHQDVMKRRAKFFEEVREVKVAKLTPLDLDLDLESGEDAYAFETNIRVYFNQVGKKPKTNKMYRRFNKATDENDNYDENELYTITETGHLKLGISLKSAKHQYLFPDLEGLILVTNQRIVFSSPERVETVALDDVKKLTFSMVPLDKTFYEGFILITTNGDYEVISQNIETGLVIQELIKKEKSNRD